MNKIKENDNPVLKELKKKIKKSRNELIKLIDEWDYLHNTLYPELNYLYEFHFAETEGKIKQRKEKILELTRKIEILSSGGKNGNGIGTHTFNYINRIVTKELSDKKNHNGNGKAKINNGMKQYEQIPYFYRSLVKKLHPDVAGSNGDFEKFWFNVQDAYKNGNVDRLRLFYDVICDDEIKNFSNNYSEELTLRNRLRRIEMNISAEKRNIKRIRQEEPYIFENKLKNNFWIEKKLKSLEEELYSLEQQIDTLTKNINQITGAELEYLETK